MEEIIHTIEKTISPVLEKEKFELVEIGYFYSGGKRALRLLIDRWEGGITLDDCANLSERIGRMLDNLDIIKESYALEVSSPGIDRPLKKKNDFLKVKGKKLKVFLFEYEGGKKEFSGILKDTDDEFIFLETQKEILKIPLTKITKARQII